MKQQKAITLIALVITIIILLILVGISISTLMGERGILRKADITIEKNKETTAEEEIKLILNEWRIEKVETTKTFLEFLDSKVEKNQIDKYERIDEESIGIYRNNYIIIVDNDGKIIKNIQKVGPVPTIENIKITLEDGTEAEEYSQKIGTKFIISFDAMIKDGIIKSIYPQIPYTTNGEEKIVEFEIIGTVNDIDYTTNVKISLESKYIKQYESLEKAISDQKESGYKQVQILAKNEVVTHDMNIIIYNGDLVLDGIKEVNGASLNNNVYTFGNATTDVGTKTTVATNMVVLKINGNFVINEAFTLTSCISDNGYGGSKGFVIYCTNEITNNGKISMSDRGAKAKGQNVYLYKNLDETYEYVPAIGANRWRKSKWQ